MLKKTRGFRDLAVSWVPFGLNQTKPRHFREMLRIIWQNRDNLSYAWKVLTRGVCDGCALGTSGLKDWTIDGTHLCLVRLNLLRLNTMPALDHSLLSDVDALKKMSSKDMRALGRLAYPMRRRKGERGFTQVKWSDLWADVGARWRNFDPQRTSMFVTSRGVTNEVYYTAQKVMRYLGTNNVDNSARLCHSPSTSGLKSTIGVAATTCSYKDFYETDLIVFFGSNPANDQPVTMKYLAEARKRGARVLSVNAYREPGMERYWVPSNADSCLFGTKMTDRLFMVRIGGDLAFLNAVQKVLIANNWHKPEFIAAASTGFEDLKKALDAQSMDMLLAACGLKLEDIEAFAKELAEADRGIFIWSMGITQHAHGADTVRAIVNLGLLREYVGRPGTGMMPIRGHSGVQGGAEMGAYSTAFPGGLTINAENAAHFSKLWGFEVSSEPGLTAVDALEAAACGELDGFYCIGGNFLETMPDPARIAAALAKISLRLHSDIVLTNQMLVDPADTVYILPTRTRYEQRDGGTETSTERRVIYSPYIPGHDLGETRSEWEMLLDFAKAVKPDGYGKVHFASGAEIRADIERANPAYTGIAKLSKQGDQFQWGGPLLCAERVFPTSDKKAHFQPVIPPTPRNAERNPDKFVLATRRGKQFNSMIQSDVDALTGAHRDHIFISPFDATRLGLTTDDRILLKSATGEYRARAFVAEVTPGTLQGHWPEVNVLIASGIVDAFGGVPDYNAEVSITPERR
jgi:molybdopterin-dependent oxidoreductase alpha subunit